MKYWDPGWQAILYGNPDAYLDKIIAAGFDGVYLDIIDAFEYFEDSRKSAMNEMMDLVIDMANYAREKDPDFIFITQNGERVLGHKRLLAVIDGAAKEDLYFGLEGDSIPAPDHETDYSLKYLKKAQKAGKFVLLASYVPEPEGQQKVLEGSEKHGFTTYFGTRELDQLLKDSGKGLQPYESSESSFDDFERNFTPGTFYLTSLPKNRWRYTVTAENYDEKSVYEERDETGAITFSEDVRFEERQIRVGAEYGVTENFEIGLVVPFVETELNLREIGGEGLRSTDKDSGIGNLTLTADLFKTLSDIHDVYALLSTQIAFPTDTQKEDLKSQGSANIRGSLEKFWGPVGLSVTAGGRYTGEDGFDDGDTIFIWLAGGLVEFNDRLYLSANVGQEDETDIAESSFEILLGTNTSLELFGGTELENDEDYWYGGLSLNFIR